MQAWGDTREKLQIFDRVKNKVRLLMEIRQKKNKCRLIINLIYLVSKDQYQLIIGNHYIQTNEMLCNIFRSPIQLFEEIKLNFNELIFDSKGGLAFDMNIGKAKSRPIFLKTAFRMNQKQQNKQISSGKDINSKMMEQILTEMKDLKLSFVYQIKQLTKTFQRHRNLHKLQIMDLRKQNKRLKKEFLNIQEKFNKQNQRDKEKESWCDIIDIGPRQNLDSNHIIEFNPHPQHKGNYHFCLKEGNILKRTETEDQKNWQNFILQNALLPGQSYTLDINIVESMKNMINVGIISKDGFNKNNTLLFEDFTVCYLKIASIWRSGNCRSKSLNDSFKVNETVRVIVDRKLEQIQWFKWNIDTWKSIDSISLPECVSEQQVYFVTTMRHNDTIRLIRY